MGPKGRHASRILAPGSRQLTLREDRHVRVATYQAGRTSKLAFVVNDRLVDLEAVARRKKVKVPGEMIGLIAEVPAATLRTLAGGAEAWVKAGRPSIPVSRAKLLAPIQRPRKNIVCMGRNYAEHARAGGGGAPGVPLVFTQTPPTGR